MTEETRQKIRIARAKQDPKSLSHPHSPESKLKMSLAHKGLPSKKKGIPTGVTGWNKGKKLHYTVWNKGTKGLMPVPWNKGIKFTQVSGENNPNWKGGITPENHKIRNSFEYKLWRKSCFIRDNFTCQKTGISGGKLIVHHINNFSDFPELRLSIDNGITLSQQAHEEFHHIYGVKNNTLEQLIEFLNK